PVLTVRGFDAVAVAAAAPVEADATLLLSAPAAGPVTATVTLSGLSAADLAAGQAASFTAAIPAGATPLPLPLRFAAQTLAADKAGRLGLSSPSGATLGSPAGFQFALKANVGSRPTVSITRGFDAVR